MIVSATAPKKGDVRLQVRKVVLEAQSEAEERALAEFAVEAGTWPPGTVSMSFLTFPMATRRGREEVGS